MQEKLSVSQVKPVDAPLQKDATFLPEWIEVDLLVRAGEARARFRCDGSGTTVAVLDTGLRTTHIDFTGRVATQRNFTDDNNSDPDNASDGNGHGTNVSGIICAGHIHTGIAPGARVVPLKVLNNQGSGSFTDIRDALDWVIQNGSEHNISAACLSLGDGGNYQSDDRFAEDAIGERLLALTDAGIVCCLAAGNDYFVHNSQQGMSYPAILRPGISVGAVFDNDEGQLRYNSGAIAFTTAPDRITPFSQRLHRNLGGEAATDIFAPGAPVTSSGIRDDTGVSVQQGTSQATPVVAGVVLLLQSFHRRVTGRMPTAIEVRQWLLNGAATITDGDDENDNVNHTGLNFLRIDATAALTACARELAPSDLINAGVELDPNETV